jgi:hypothetical protein
MTDFVDLLEEQLVAAHARRPRGLRALLPSARGAGAIGLAAAAAAVVLLVVALASPDGRRAARPADPPASAPVVTVPRTAPAPRPATPAAPDVPGPHAPQRMPATPAAPAVPGPHAPTPATPTAPTAPRSAPVPNTPKASTVPPSPPVPSAPKASTVPPPAPAPATPARPATPPAAVPAPPAAPVRPHAPAPAPPSVTTVAVLNASGAAGVGRVVANRVSAFGYRIGLVTNRLGRVPHSSVRYAPGRRRAAVAVARRLGIRRVLPSTRALRRQAGREADVVVVLGRDRIP